MCDCPQLKPILEPTYGCIVSRSCRSCGIWQDIHLEEVTFCRRAMSKKKGDVMERERQNFVYGNPEEGVPGCLARGLMKDGQ